MGRGWFEQGTFGHSHCPLYLDCWNDGSLSFGQLDHHSGRAAEIWYLLYETWINLDFTSLWGI